MDTSTSSQIKRSLSFFPLDGSGKLQSLSNLTKSVESGGVHVFYTGLTFHQTAILNLHQTLSGQLKIEKYISLDELIGGDSTADEIIRKLPEDYIAIQYTKAEQQASELNRLHAVLRYALDKKIFENKKLVMIVNASVRDFLNPVEESLATHFAEEFKEYILCYENKLYKKPDDELNPGYIWQCHGLAAWFYQKDLQDNNPIYLSKRLSEKLESALDQLYGYESLLEKMGKGIPGATHNPKRDYSYLIELLNFLPSYRKNPDDNPIRASHWEDFNKEGPQAYVDITELSVTSRHLLLDGWLTLWPAPKETSNHATKWLIQPGSLALLYWAAQRMQYLYSETPERFLRHYFDLILDSSGKWQRWSNKTNKRHDLDNWFGGWLANK